MTKIVNGGWHDAGDLSQGAFRTGMAVYAMMELYRQLDMRSMDKNLKERALEEAMWGLHWLLKTRFSGGYRMTWFSNGIYSDGITGTVDDVIVPAQNIQYENFIAAAAEALSFHALEKRNPALAAQSLSAAEEDWEAAAAMTEGQAYSGSRGMDPIPAVNYLALSWGIVSSVHLYHATGNERYRDCAVRYGEALTRCQQQRFIKGVPLTGFFYTGPDKEALLHHYHFGFEESPLLALTELCRAFPGHEQWMDWYGAAVLHSEYFMKRGAEYTKPYRVLPNSVYRKSDIENVKNDEIREAMFRQFYDGTKLTEEYYLRFFPVWVTATHHGSTAPHLSETLALNAAASLRNDSDAENLAARQLQWVFGINPFCQSLMYGEGYDYAPQYGPNPGNIVGSLPVGIDCFRNDLPFWSASNNATYKEIWVVPVTRFLWNAAYSGVPAFVRGRVRGGEGNTVSFMNMDSGLRKQVRAGASGAFSACISPGTYEITFGNMRKSLCAVSGAVYDICLDEKKLD